MTAGSAAKHGYRPDLDGLRALSILLVVAFHAGFGAFAGGYVGVDVFFVISGFLITGLLVAEHERNSRVSLRDFYARRARRLLPMAFLVIIITLLVGGAMVAPLDRIGLTGDAIASSLYFANWRFAAQSVAYWDGEVTESLFLHYWSLSVEEQFYILWPIVVVATAALARRRGWSLRSTLGVAVGTLSIGSLAFSVFASHQSGNAYYFTHTRIWELGAGAGLALIGSRLPSLRRIQAEVLAIAGLLMIVGAAMLYDEATVFPGYTALLPVLGCIALIVAGSSNHGYVSRFLSTDAMTYVGRLSYSWYLWHWPAMGVAGLIALRVGREPTAPLLLAGILVSFALAVASHHFVEQPIRYAPGLATRPGRALAIAATLALIPAATAVGLRSTVNNSAAAPVLASPSSNQPPATDEPTAGSESPTGLPAGFVPMTPEQAAEDTVKIHRRECHSTQGPQIDVGLDCVYGDSEGELTIVLIGDSHAQHWLPALDTAGKERGWRVFAWTKSACTPVEVRIRNSRLEREYHECYEWRGRVVEAVAAIGGSDVVIVADSYGYGGSLLADDGKEAPPDLVYEMWRDGAARMFERYEALSEWLILMRDTPWVHRRVPSCLSEDPSNPQRCAFPLEGRVHRDETWTAAEFEAANGQVGVIDMTSVICETDPCQVVTEEGLIKYRDSHHLTATYSSSLATALADALDDELRRVALKQGG